ncbi:unnamed protein product [Rotaria socialis]|uniref:Uncharacterized protein n=1 Tax=Rotaria socialis TaxID=392032 RepID=A0A818GBN0_9BILA|nr:unnamed protein product [Rotaria socialis]CAF3438171.1 unnamed protein product [Rotaria socialis]CAF3486995.1 unnamed protein product [Rotaria socialis]CAF3576964.1 unnamed protein product [Rotaria socialis]CAF4106268.1 unnamed protein product [Rotaria socialis]
MQQPSNRILSVAVLGVVLAVYLLRKSKENKIDNEEASVSLCQVHAQLDEFDRFDDQTLLSVLAALKSHDFHIGQPVWGPSNNILYLCEHQLKAGLKHSIIDQELKTVLKNHGESRKHLAWTCV